MELNVGCWTDASEGIELSDINAAWQETAVALGQLIRDLNGSIKPGTVRAIEVQDKQRRPLRYISLSVGTLSPGIVRK